MLDDSASVALAWLALRRVRPLAVVRFRLLTRRIETKLSRKESYRFVRIDAAHLSDEIDVGPEAAAPLAGAAVVHALESVIDPVHALGRAAPRATKLAGFEDTEP